jgi:hypothetical protein
MLGVAVKKNDGSYERVENWGTNWGSLGNWRNERWN